jgi:F0F1-type ATP synthase beta subunit
MSAGTGTRLVPEVQQHLGHARVRAVAIKVVDLLT